MPLTLSQQRRLGYGGQKHPWRRKLFSTLARNFARRAGGVIFLEDDALLVEMRRELGLPEGPPLSKYLDELLADQPLRAAFQEAREKHGVDEDATYEARLERLRGVVTVYYALMREWQPSVVVETGTAAGSYTSFVLAALNKNGKGRLISIDIPPVRGRLQMNMTVDADAVGYFLPREYRDAWTYKQGDAKCLLPDVLAEEDADVFIHDSLHTRTHMLFEYAVARALMDDGKVIVSDDIMWNNAFNDFLATNRLTGYSPYSKPGTGVFVNRFDEAERSAGLGVQRDA